MSSRHVIHLIESDARFIREMLKKADALGKALNAAGFQGYENGSSSFSTYVFGIEEAWRLLSEALGEPVATDGAVVVP